MERDSKDSQPKRRPERDARGQSEQRHKGGSNKGVASADPRVLSGDEDGDATFPIQRS